MDHHTAVWQAAAFPFCCCTKQHRSHGGSHPGTDGGHVRLYELHGIVDTKSGVDTSTRRINIDLNILGSICTFKKQHLCLNYVCHLVIYSCTQKYDPVHHQTGEHVKDGDVHLPLLDNVRGHAHWVHAAYDLAVIVAVDAMVFCGVFFKFFSVIHINFKFFIFLSEPQEFPEHQQIVNF